MRSRFSTEPGPLLQCCGCLCILGLIFFVFVAVPIGGVQLIWKKVEVMFENRIHRETVAAEEELRAAATRPKPPPVEDPYPSTRPVAPTDGDEPVAGPGGMIALRHDATGRPSVVAVVEGGTPSRPDGPASRPPRFDPWSVFGRRFTDAERAAESRPLRADEPHLKDARRVALRSTTVAGLAVTTHHYLWDDKDVGFDVIVQTVDPETSGRWIAEPDARRERTSRFAREVFDDFVQRTRAFGRLPTWEDGWLGLQPGPSTSLVVNHPDMGGVLLTIQAGSVGNRIAAVVGWSPLGRGVDPTDLTRIVRGFEWSR